jgi:hypothetical protein
MREAAFDANDRLRSVNWHLDLATFHAPLSETLVWISAMAEAVGKIQDPSFSSCSMPATAPSTEWRSWRPSPSKAQASAGC